MRGFLHIEAKKHKARSIGLSFLFFCSFFPLLFSLSSFLVLCGPARLDWVLYPFVPSFLFSSGFSIFFFYAGPLDRIEFVILLFLPSFSCSLVPLCLFPFACSPWFVPLCLFPFVLFPFAWSFAFVPPFLCPILRRPVLPLNFCTFVRSVRSFCSAFLAVHFVTFSLVPTPHGCQRILFTRLLK